MQQQALTLGNFDFVISILLLACSCSGCKGIVVIICRTDQTLPWVSFESPCLHRGTVRIVGAHFGSSGSRLRPLRTTSSGSFPHHRQAPSVGENP